MMLDEFDDRVIKIDVAFSENWEARRFDGIMKMPHKLLFFVLLFSNIYTSA